MFWFFVLCFALFPRRAPMFCFIFECEKFVCVLIFVLLTLFNIQTVDCCPGSAFYLYKQCMSDSFVCCICMQCTISIFQSCSQPVIPVDVVVVVVVAELTQSIAEIDVWKGLQFMKIISATRLLVLAAAAVLLHDSPLNLHIEHIASSLQFNVYKTLKRRLKPYRLWYCYGWKLIECCFVVILWKCRLIVSLFNGTDRSGWCFAISSNATNTWYITHSNTKWWCISSLCMHSQCINSFIVAQHHTEKIGFVCGICSLDFQFTI